MEQETAHEIAFCNHGIGRPGDMRQRVAARHKTRPHALKQARSLSLRQGPDIAIRHTDQANNEAQRFGLLDIGGTDLRDARGCHSAEINLAAEPD